MKRFIFLTFACLVGILILTPGSQAGSCKSVSNHVVSPFVTQPFVAQNVVSGYNTGYGYDNVVLQPYAIPVVILPQTFYSVLPELGYARINQELVAKAAEDGTRKALQELLLRGAPTNPDLNIPDVPYKENVKSKNDSTLESKVKNTFQDMVTNKCLKCHDKGSELDLSDINALDRSARLEIVYRIMTDDPKLKMPKGGVTVSTAELDSAHAFVLGASKTKVSDKVNTEIPKAKE